MRHSHFMLLISSFFAYLQMDNTYHYITSAPCAFSPLHAHYVIQGYLILLFLPPSGAREEKNERGHPLRRQLKEKVPEQSKKRGRQSAICYRRSMHIPCLDGRNDLMPQRDQHNANDPQSQAASSAQECWDELVEQRLPANLESQARVLGAFQRVRELSSARVLLRALLCYVLSLSSLKHLSGWSRLVGVTSKVLSAQAWHRRLRHCAPWLLWLFTQMLNLRLSTGGLPTQQRLLLVDATHLAEMGPKADNWSLHCAYDLLEGQLAWVQVTDQHQGEGFTHIPLQPGDILVGDGAYSRASQLLAVDAAQAFSLT